VKDQVITPKTSGRTTARTRSGPTGQQKPIRRERTGGARSKTSTSGTGEIGRRILGWLPRAFKVGLAVTAGVLVFAGYHAAASASFFQVRSVDVSGVSRTEADDVKAIVRRVSATTGVWRADIDQMSKEICKLTWVRTAVVSRVLPDGVRVRITERTPRAVAHLGVRFYWVDEDAAVLGVVQPTDKLPDFFLRGWDEANTQEAREENRRRVQTFLQMSDDFVRAGVASRVSEIDVNDLRDIRAQLAGDDAEISIWLGNQNFAKRLKNGLEKLDKSLSEGLSTDIVYLDSSQDDRVTIGTNHQVAKKDPETVAALQGVKNNSALKAFNSKQPAKNDNRQSSRKVELASAKRSGADKSRSGR
jgi:cell division protein FtsQ